MGMYDNPPLAPLESGLDTLRLMPEDKKQKLYLKVNLPDSWSSYRTGNGEGMWAIPATPADCRAIEVDQPGTTAKVILCNDSVYHLPLVFGTVIQVEMRPGFRPVLDVLWLHDLLTPVGVDFKSLLGD